MAPLDRLSEYDVTKTFRGHFKSRVGVNGICDICRGRGNKIRTCLIVVLTCFCEGTRHSGVPQPRPLTRSVSSSAAAEYEPHYSDRSLSSSAHQTYFHFSAPTCPPMLPRRGRTNLTARSRCNFDHVARNPEFFLACAPAVSGHSRTRASLLMCTTLKRAHRETTM